MQTTRLQRKVQYLGLVVVLIFTKSTFHYYVTVLHKNQLVAEMFSTVDRFFSPDHLMCSVFFGFLAFTAPF